MGRRAPRCHHRSQGPQKDLEFIGTRPTLLLRTRLLRKRQEKCCTSCQSAEHGSFCRDLGCTAHKFSSASAHLKTQLYKRGRLENRFSYHLAAFGRKGGEGVSLGAVKEIQKSL